MNDQRLLGVASLSAKVRWANSEVTGSETVQALDDGNLTSDPMAAVAAAFRSNAVMYGDMGTPLYRCIFERAADDPELLALANQGQSGAKPVHLLSAVHHLLLRDPGDPLDRFFPTLSDEPAPPEQAFPLFQRFCRERHSDILTILRTRTVQSTYVERCWVLAPALAHVAGMAGEPLDLVEIGCSAGVLLTYDQYAYDHPDHEPIGGGDAPLTLRGRIAGRPPMRIARAGKRIGIDLNPLDASSADDRRWLRALCFPEFREQQARLDTALDVTARTDICLLKGDALDRLPEALAMTHGPVCVFHSVCLLYWPSEAKVALHRLLCETSRTRDIYRLGFELSEEFDAFHAGQGAAPAPGQRLAGMTFDVTCTRYSEGEAESRIIAHATPDFTYLNWLASVGSSV